MTQWNREIAMRKYQKDYDEARKLGRIPLPMPERFTCDGCDDKDECEFAWDYYNQHGDCLAMK